MKTHRPIHRILLLAAIAVFLGSAGAGAAVLPKFVDRIDDPKACD